MTELKSVRRASLRRSSLGLQRKWKVWPSLAIMPILRGFCREGMIVIPSRKPAIVKRGVSKGRFVLVDADAGVTFVVNDSWRGRRTGESCTEKSSGHFTDILCRSSDPGSKLQR